MTYFTYNGRSSAEFGLHIEKKDVFSAPEYDAEFISIPGRSGDIINPNRRFANIKVTYTVFLARKNVAALASNLRDIKGWLYSEPDRYHELTDSYDAEYFRYGVISGNLDIEEQLNKIGCFTVTFNCKPFKYSFARQQTVSADASELTITNPTAFESRPYTPDWKTKNLVLTPSLYVIGTTADQIATPNVTSVKWYVGDSNTAITAGTNYALSGAKSHILTVKANVMAELPGIDYRCVITYKDESTGLSLTHPLTISFSRVVNGSGIVDLLVTTPNGNVFKNEEVASLTAKAELWRGSTVDTTKVSYKWAVMDTSVTATSSTGYDADFGIGWRKLSDTADKYTGTATNTLTVYAAAVDSYAVFKCCAQDTDSASASYNTKFFDVATFIDNSDPLQIIVTSTGGDVFKNGQGTTVLTAVCYQAGSEVDAAGNGSYTWTKYNKDGAIDTAWGTNGSKTGKTLSVSSADVDTKATFMVVVAL